MSEEFKQAVEPDTDTYEIEVIDYRGQKVFSLATQEEIFISSRLHANCFSANLQRISSEGNESEVVSQKVGTMASFQYWHPTFTPELNNFEMGEHPPILPAEIFDVGEKIIIPKWSYDALLEGNDSLIRNEKYNSSKMQPLVSTIIQKKPEILSYDAGKPLILT